VSRVGGEAGEFVVVGTHRSLTLSRANSFSNNRRTNSPIDRSDRSAKILARRYSYGYSNIVNRLVCSLFFLCNDHQYEDGHTYNDFKRVATCRCNKSNLLTMTRRSRFRHRPPGRGARLQTCGFAFPAEPVINATYVLDDFTGWLATGIFLDQRRKLWQPDKRAAETVDLVPTSACRSQASDQWIFWKRRPTSPRVPETRILVEGFWSSRV
jgi:hypothetical protein